METTITNLTPHEVTILGGVEPLVIAPSGAVARVTMTRTEVDRINGIPVYRSTPGPVTGLPAPEAGILFLTSMVVRLAAERADVVSPGELVRGVDGQPTGCRGVEVL